MGVVIHEPFIQLLHIDDELTWFEQVLTDEGILLKPINGLSPLHDHKKELEEGRENWKLTTATKK